MPAETTMIVPSIDNLSGNCCSNRAVRRVAKITAVYLNGVTKLTSPTLTAAMLRKYANGNANAAAIIKPIFNVDGVCHEVVRVKRPPAKVIAIAVMEATKREGVVIDRPLVITSLIEIKMAEHNADNENIENPSNPGFIINNTPIKPRQTASHLRHPTGSDKTTAAMNVSIKGTD